MIFKLMGILLSCAASLLFFGVSSLNAQTVTTSIVNDIFADGISNNGPQQIGFHTISSNFALDLNQAPGPLDFASGNSGRSISGIFAPQTLSSYGDQLRATFDFTTPASIANDNGGPSSNEDFKFGLFNTAPAAGAIDVNTGLPIDFGMNISTSSGTPNTALNNLAGFMGEIDNINAAGTDLGIRTHNVNNLPFVPNVALPGGQFLNSNTGFDFIAGGTDDIITLVPNTDYVGTLLVAYTDATLTTFDITVGMMDAAGVAFSDSLTQTISIADNSPSNIGVNTTTFDMLAFHATSGAFGGTDNPGIAGSSTVGEANNGIDITNVTIEFTTTVPEPGRHVPVGWTLYRWVWFDDEVGRGTTSTDSTSTCLGHVRTEH